MPDTVTQRIADTVRAEAARHRLSQRDIANQTGMSESSIARRFAGLVAFTVPELAAVAGVFGMPVTALIEEPSLGETA